jgi:hypothetical protein
VARHASPSAYARRGTPSRAPQSSSRGSTTARVVVAAVAAGAALPAVQTLDTHFADAESTAGMQQADLSLAASHGPTVRPASTHTAPGHRTGWSAVTPVVGGYGSARAAQAPSAGDGDDLSSLTKAIRIDRENGPLEFGKPYVAGGDDDLDDQIAKALGLMGLPQKLAPGVKKIIMRESTGNADAVNGWDSNAAAGTPSKGLMQLIDTTFKNAVLPSLKSKGIFDPVANITAGVRTMIANHSISDVMAGGLKNSSGNYIGYGGSKLPDDGLG